MAVTTPPVAAKPLNKVPSSKSSGRLEDVPLMVEGHAVAVERVLVERVGGVHEHDASLGRVIAQPTRNVLAVTHRTGT